LRNFWNSHAWFFSAKCIFSSANCEVIQPKKIHFCDIKKLKKNTTHNLPDFLSMRAADPAPMCDYRRETLEGVTWGVTGGVGRLSKIGTEPNCCQEGS
jgi:hypothetical protein